MKKLGLGLIMGSVLFSQGCSMASNNASATNGVEITIATYADPIEVELVMSQAQAYMDENPGVELIVEPVAGDFEEVLKTRMIANDEPDIFYMDMFLVDQFIDAEKLAPLNEVIEADLDDFEPTLVNAFKGEDNVIYGIPKDFSTLALFYNKTIFEEAGVTPPTTWEELEDVATALTSDEVVGLTIQNGIDRIQPFVYSNGGSMMKDGVPAVNQLQNIEAYKFWDQLLTSGIAKTPQTLGVGWTGDAFASEIAAMTIEGTWLVNNLQEVAPDLDYGVVPIPVSETPASMQFTVAYSMSKNTEYPEEVKDVIKFLTSTEQQLIVAEAGKSMPSRKSALDTFVQMYPEREVFAQLASVASEFNYGVISPTVVQEVGKALEKVMLTDDITIEEAFNEAQENIETALSRY